MGGFGYKHVDLRAAPTSSRTTRHQRFGRCRRWSTATEVCSGLDLSTRDKLADGRQDAEEKAGCGMVFWSSSAGANVSRRISAAS